jgi:hypothetical protein
MFSAITSTSPRVFISRPSVTQKRHSFFVTSLPTKQAGVNLAKQAMAVMARVMAQ